MVDDTFSRLLDEAEAGRDRGLVAPDASADLVFVRRFLSAADRVRMEPVPASVRTAVDARFETWRIARVPAPLRTRLIAALTREVLPGTVVAGARGVTAARHLVFTSGVADISVHVRAQRTGGAIDGMILRADELDAADTVRLVSDGATVASTTTDPVGSFRFDAVPVGQYVLVADIEEHEISTTAFEIVAEAG